MKFTIHMIQQNISALNDKIDDLNSQVDDLNTEIDNIQTQNNEQEQAIGGSNNLGYAGIALGIIALLVAIAALFRKPKAPAAAPEETSEE